MNPPNSQTHQVLVSRSFITGKIRSIEDGQGKCRERFYFFGGLVPTFQDGDKNYAHSCFYVNSFEYDALMAYKPYISALDH